MGGGGEGQEAGREGVLLLKRAASAPALAARLPGRGETGREQAGRVLTLWRLVWVYRSAWCCSAVLKTRVQKVGNGPCGRPNSGPASVACALCAPSSWVVGRAGAARSPVWAASPHGPFRARPPRPRHGAAERGEGPGRTAGCGALWAGGWCGASLTGGCVLLWRPSRCPSAELWGRAPALGAAEWEPLSPQCPRSVAAGAHRAAPGERPGRALLVSRQSAPSPGSQRVLGSRVLAASSPRPGRGRRSRCPSFTLPNSAATKRSFKVFKS